MKIVKDKYAVNDVTPSLYIPTRLTPDHRAKSNAHLMKLYRQLDDLLNFSPDVFLSGSCGLNGEETKIDGFIRIRPLPTGNKLIYEVNTWDENYRTVTKKKVYEVQVLPNITRFFIGF